MVEERNAGAPGYGCVAKTLHWLIVALLIAQFTVAWTMPDIGRNTKPETLINLHLSFGFTILIVVVLRLLWRWTHPVPLLRDDVPMWQHRAAQATHALLYLVLLVLPGLGWIAASARGWTLSLFGIVPMPRLIEAAPAVAGRIGDLHTLVSYVLLGLVGLHVLAALYHYLWRRDGVLQRMLPATR